MFKNNTKIIPEENIKIDIKDIKKVECIVCYDVKNLQDYRCSIYCNINKLGEKTWFICENCYKKYRSTSNKCIVCSSPERVNDDVINYNESYCRNKLNKILKYAFLKIKNINCIDYCNCNCNCLDYCCKIIVNNDISDTFSKFLISMFLLSGSFIIFTVFSMICSKLENNVCFMCVIFSIFGTMIFILNVINLLLYNNIIINNLEKKNKFYLNLLCIFLLALILTIVEIIYDCNININYFYIIIFNFLGVTFFNYLFT